MDLETAVAPSPIEIEPPDIEGEVLLTLKKKKPQRRHRTRKYHAILTKGYLQLFTNRQATTHRYQIDLSKVIISEENGAIVLGFRVESHALVPEDTKNFEKWKDAVLLHQQYRRVRTR
ncbi:hypothetical protein Y032_0101g3419 [Ancylostoma ceylanicum]|nr:hypothetical protein Y032_0101g3419 [Ancylostoma ceylanicum]